MKQDNTVQINIETGLLEEAIYLPSPHFNDRPENVLIDMIVVHGISLPPGQFGSNIVEQFFCGKLPQTSEDYIESIKDLRVSAHLFITREGEIKQFVSFKERAWHAGVSSFQGREGCNDFSIGIELEGTDNIPYEKIQYEKLVKIVRALIKTYPAITRERIVGHSDIAPGRKTDPGRSFNWGYFDCLFNTDTSII